MRDQFTTFDGLFDDVYQVPQLVRALGISTPASSIDLRARLGLAAIMGESILVPVTLLIDHNPLWEVLDDDEWASCIFKHGLLRPACSEMDNTYDDIYRHLRRTTPELTSHPNESREVRAAAPAERADVFDAMHGPWLKPRFDRLSTMARIGDPDKTCRWSPGSVYGLALKRLVAEALRRPSTEPSYRIFHGQLAGDRDLQKLTRTKALDIVDLLELEGKITERGAFALRSLVIHAKFEEIRVALRTDLVGIVTPPRERDDSKKIVKYATECRILGGVLSERVGPGHLDELLTNNYEFLRLRNKFTRKYRSNIAASGVIDSLRTVCEAAAETLGSNLSGAEVAEVVDENLRRLVDSSVEGRTPTLSPNSAAFDTRDGFVEMRTDITAMVRRRAAVSVLFQQDMIKGFRDILTRIRLL